MPKPSARLPGPDDATWRGVSAIIVTYNSSRHIGPLAASLTRLRDEMAVNIIVCDNDSRDDTLPLLRAQLGRLTIIEMGRNAGYAAAINEGLKHVSAEMPFLILNPDVTFDPTSVKRLLSALQTQPGIAVAVPRLRDSHGDMSYSLRREPSLLRELVTAVCGQRLGQFSFGGELIRDRKSYEVGHRCDWATGAVIACCPELRLLRWNPDYFLYSEETEFFRAVRSNYGGVWYEPDAEFLHKGGEAGTRPELWALLITNKVRYYGKYHSRPQMALFWCVVAFGCLLRLHRPTYRLALRGLCDMTLRRRRHAWTPTIAGNLPTAYQVGDE